MTVKADDLTKGWENGLRPLRTHHMISNHLVTISGDTAEAVSNVRALHYVPNDMGISTWQVYVTYNHRLVRSAGAWKITVMKLNRLMADGQCGALRPGRERRKPPGRRRLRRMPGRSSSCPGSRVEQGRRVGQPDRPAVSAAP